MNYIFFLIPILLIGIPFAHAEVEKGYNYDRQVISIDENGAKTVKWTSAPPRIFDGESYQDFIYRETISSHIMETEGGTVTLDKTTCGFSFHKKGFIHENPNALFSDSIKPYNSISGSGTWNEVTQITNAACEAYQDDNSLVAKKFVSGVGLMEYKYIYLNGIWKTQLEVTNLTSLTNRIFGFNQAISLNRDTIKFNGITRNLDNFNGTTFDKQWITNNKANLMDLLNGYHYDLDLALGYLDSITIIDSGVNSSVLVFHFRGTNVIMPNEKLIIDPTYSSNNPTVDGFIRRSSAGGCPASAAFTKNTGGTTITVGADSATTCYRAFFEWDISSITAGSQVSDTVFKYETASATGTAPACNFRGNTAAQPTTASDINLWNAIGNGTLYVSSDNGCKTAAINKSIDLTASADAEVESQIAVGWFALGIVASNEGTTGDNAIFIASEENATPEPPPTLEITYTELPKPDAVDDLSSPSQSYGSVDLLWTQPELNGGNASGYQINYTTPWGNPNTILTNNTGTTTTSATVSGLDISTDYTFGVSVWTETGNNATKPPMVWLNVTTQGNFTIGNAAFNQTNTSVLPITFEVQDINATAKFLNVTYANTFTLACDFNYQFANTNRTYTGLTGTAVSSTLDETYFILTDFDNEIINVDCYDTITGTDGEYLLTQSDFPLLEQIANFRNGTYGTMGMFGAFDFITICVVIFSMIGLNRVNESVGIIFNVMILGVLAWFAIIELPTVIFGLLAILMVFVITSTRKD